MNKRFRAPSEFPLGSITGQYAHAWLELYHGIDLNHFTELLSRLKCSAFRSKTKVIRIALPIVDGLLHPLC